MSDIELDDSDQEVSASHSKLLDAVAQLDRGQRVKKPERNEPTLHVSEFHLVKSGISDKDAVHVQDLAKALGKKGHHAEITRKLQATRQKAKLLTKPLEKPAADRIKRIVGFEAAKKDLKKWNAVITKNRVAEHLKFPLPKTHMKPDTSNQFVKRFRIQSDLEKELAALEPQKENIEEKKDDQFTMTLNEIMMRRQETAKVRAQQSYMEAKNFRQKKIKSKKFHRVQKKEKIKTQLKEFETLQKTDPEAALEKLEQLDKARAEERMSLRHKSTGKWAKNKQIRAKYDKETRQVLAEQLSIGREITQKVKKDSDSDDDAEDVDTSVQLSATDKENPWVGRGKTEEEIDDFIKGYRKYWDEKNKDLVNEKANTTEENKTKAEATESLDHSLEDTDEERMEHSEQDTSRLDTSQEATDEMETDRHSEESDEEKLDEDEPSDSDEEMQEEEKEEDVKIHTNQQKSQRSPEKNERRKRKITNESRPNSTSVVPVANKKKKVQVKKKKNPIATSAWYVEIVGDEKTENDSIQEIEDDGKDTPEAQDILELFDSVEDRIKSKVQSKLKKVTKELSQTKPEEPTRKKRTKNKDVFDGLEMKSDRKRPTIDEGLDETTNQENSDGKSDLAKLVSMRNTVLDKGTESSKLEAEIDPNKYINVKPKHLNTQLPDMETHGEEALDDSEDEQEEYNVISEAFADDDVVDQFRKEKEEEVEKSKPKSIDLTLPGWGSWGGKDIEVPKRKRRRFIMKMPERVERRDENKGDVIIMEEAKPKIKEHLVNELPYPFTSVKDFEASIRMPIGRNFVPENSHRKLIEPAVKTSMGKIIEPMDEDTLVKKPRIDRKKFAKRKGVKIATKKKVAKKS